MMKRILVLMSSLALAGLVSLASAHEGDTVPDHGAAVDARATAAGNRVEGSVVVPGTVAALKADLYRFERWPRVFSDVRGLKRNGDGSWSVDFQRFGHAHDFRITRTPAGVVLELAAKDHGSARMEYALEPIDATRSKLTIRLFMTTPPQLTSEQALGVLRAKAQADLDDFAKSANNR
jgi:hypothetical protein